MSISIKHRVVLDLTHTGHQVTIPFTQGDLVAHEIIFSLRYGISPVELPPGTLAAIFVHNGANETGVADNCVINHVEGTISYTPTPDSLSVAGNIECDMRIIGEDGASLGTPRFIFAVQNTGMDQTESEIDNALRANSSWEIIQKTVSNANEAAASAGAASESKNKATAYANDAKSSADDAKGYADDAKGYADDAAEIENNMSEKTKDLVDSIREFDERLEFLEHTGLLDSQGNYLSKNYVPQMHRIDNAEQEEDGEYGYDFGNKYDRVYIERSKGRGVYNKIALSPTPSKIYDPDRKDYYVFDENGEIKKDAEGKPILSGKTISSIPTRLDNGHILVPEQPAAYDWLYDGSDKYKKNYAVSKGLLDSLLDGKVGRLTSNNTFPQIYIEQTENRGVVGVKMSYYAKNDTANIPQRLADGTMQCIVTDDLIKKKETANYGHGNLLVANVGYVNDKISKEIANLVDSAPETLDTLNELAAALGDDPNFATTVATNIGNNASAISKVEGEIKDIKSMVEKMNYVPVSIESFTTNIPTNPEVGKIVNTLNLSWEIKGEVASISLSGTGISGKITDVSLRSYTVEGVNINVGSGGSWTLTVTGKNGETNTKNISTPEFERAIYFGISDSDGLDASDIKVALVSKLAKSCEHSFEPECQNQYIYYCSPAYFGEANFRSGYFEGGFEKLGSVSLTNSYGYTQVYYVYRSTEKLNGSITITVT